MKNFFKLAFLFQIRNKKIIFNIIFLVISLLLVLYFSSYSLSAKNYVKYDAESNDIFKKLNVGIETEAITTEDSIEIDANDYETGSVIDFNEILKEKQENNTESKVNDYDTDILETKKYTLEELEEIRLDLEKVDHIVHATNWFSYRTYIYSDTFKTNKLNGNIEIYSASNSSLPEIVLGTNFPDEEGNYMICPENFYPTDDGNYKLLSVSSKININNYLNKEIVFKYTSNVYYNNFEITYKLVGFYKNSKSEFDENVCYVTNKSFKDMAINMYSDDFNRETGENQITEQTGFVVQLDSKENVKEVQSKLSELGYNSNLMYTSDLSGLNEITSTMSKYSAFILLITFVILVIISFKQLEESRNNYSLLSYLGYRKKDIFTIHILSNILQIFISIVIAIIIALVIFSLLKLLVYIYPFIFNKWTIYTDYNVFLLLTLILIVSNIVGTVSCIIYYRSEE